jgi:hypothetical protein
MLAADFDLRARFMAMLPDVVVIWGGIGITFAIIFFVAVWYMKKAEYQKAARLYTFSSAFWARWPGQRLWVAPYDELAAEAARCEEILGGMGLKPPDYAPRENNPAVQDDGAHRGNRRIDRDGATFRAKRGAVLRAISQAMAQGRGPQSGPYRG